MKMPQSTGMGTFMCALSYVPDSNVVNVFINGTHRRDEVEVKGYLFHLSCLWQHSMLLPVIMYHEHMQNAELFRKLLNEKVVDVEQDAGYVVTGRVTPLDMEPAGSVFPNYYSENNFFGTREI